MLNADSRTLKNPSAAQRRAMPPMIPIDVAWSWIGFDDGDEAVDRARGEGAPQLFDEVARLRLLPGEGGQREREEQEGDEGEEREVGDHRREVRSTVCEELARRCDARRGSVGRGRDGRGSACGSLPPHERGSSSRRSHRDLRADRVSGARGPRRLPSSPRRSRTTERRSRSRRPPRSCSQPPTTSAPSLARSRSSRWRARHSTAPSSSPGTTAIWSPR